MTPSHPRGSGQLPRAVPRQRTGEKALVLGRGRLTLPYNKLRQAHPSQRACEHTQRELKGQ